MKPIMYLAGYTGDGGLITIDWVGETLGDDAWITTCVKEDKEFIWMSTNNWFERVLMSSDNIWALSRPLAHCQQHVQSLIKITNGRAA